MKIAVLSGKGGTGKTTVSSNLAAILGNVTLVDCDVEEPNAHLFFPLKEKMTASVYTDYPIVDMDKCTLCGACGDFCHFNAILPAKNTVLVFEENCHSCGGCSLVCAEEAISYMPREIGVIKAGISQNLSLIYGTLNIGEQSGVKIIDAVLDSVTEEEDVIIDCPPGTSCATVAAVNKADYALVVTEPTPFGVSDMKMVVEMLRKMEIPFSVVINKAGTGNNEIYHYTQKENISILGEIPFNKEVAQYYATGGLITEKSPAMHQLFVKMAEHLHAKLIQMGLTYA